MKARLFNALVSTLLALVLALTFLGLAWGLWAGAKHDLRLLVTYALMLVCVVLVIPGGPRRIRQLLSNF